MTATALIKKLEKAITTCGPRVLVTIDLKEMKEVVHHLDDGLSLWEANCFDIETVPWVVDDSSERQDGSERLKTVVVIS